MAVRSTSWRNIPSINPTRGARYTPGGLGAWRSVVSDFATTTRSGGGRRRRSGSGDGRGQPNDYERAIAEKAVKDKGGFNLFDLGGKAVGGALEALDVPGSFVRSGIKELRDIGTPGEEASFEQFKEQAARHISGQEVIGGEGIPGAIEGFAFDVLADPLTYTPLGAAKIGTSAGKPAARKFLSKAGQEAFGEAAVTAAERGGKTFTAAERAAEVAEQGKILSARAAQKTLKTPSRQVLDPLEREIIGAEKGTFLHVPGKRLKVDKLIERIAPERFARTERGGAAIRLTEKELGAGKAVAKLRTKVVESRLGNKMAQGFTKRPLLREKILFGTEHEAMSAFHALEQDTAANLQRRLKDVQWGHKLGELISRAKKAGVTGEDFTFVAAEDPAIMGPATTRVLAKAAEHGDANLVEDIRKFMPGLWEEANGLDPNLPWLGMRANYTPRRPSEEMIALGKDWGQGGRKFEQFDFERYYGLEDEGLHSDFLGEKILPPAQAKGRSVEQQMRNIATNKGLPSYFETNAYKAWPDHVRRLASRYGDEYMAKSLRDLGVLEPKLLAVMKAEGQGFGRRKATLNSMMQRAFARRDAAIAKRIPAEQRLAEVEANVQLGREAQKTAQTARREVEAEISDIRNEIGLQDAVAVREYEQYAAEEMAKVQVRRQALMANIDASADQAFVLEHAVVEQAHQLELQTYRNTEKITRLERSIQKNRDELGDIYERMRLMDGGVDFKAARASLEDLSARAEAAGNTEVWTRYQSILESPDPKPLRDWAQRNRNLGRYGSELTISGEALQQMKAAETRIIELNSKIREAYRVLDEFEDLAKLPTKQLDKQIANAELRIKQMTAEIQGPPASDLTGRRTWQPVTNNRRARLTSDIEALSKVRASALHEKSVIERARGRMAELDAQSPATWVDQVTDLRNVQDMGDNIIHTQFPDLPPEVQGSRVRDYFTERMGDIQKHIDDTEGQVMSAYADNDTLRAELSVIKKRKAAVDRDLAKMGEKTTAQQRELAEMESSWLARADEAAQRAVEIGEAQELAGVQVEGLMQQAQTQEQIEAIADRYLSVMEAKYSRYEAQATKRAATAAGRQKEAETWARIASHNFSKEQRAALKTALQSQFHEIGKISVTQERWLVDALYSSTYMNMGQFHRKVFNPALNWWKAVALSTPGTVIRNFYSAVFNNYLSPYNVELLDYKKAFGYGVSGVKHPARRETLNKADAAIFKQIEDAGLIVGSATSREVERTIGAEIGGPRANPFSTEFPTWRFMRRRQEDVEATVRGALAYRVIKEGGTMDDAIGAVMKFHFDYDDLSKYERSGIRSVVPFYTWTRKNLPLMMEQIVQNPQKFNRFYQAKNEIEELSPEEQIIPSYFTENMAVRLPFNIGQGQAYGLPDLPFTSINDVSDPTSAISQVSPFIKTPIEYAFGKQFFKGIPLKDEYKPVPSWLEGIPGIFPALNAAGLAQRNADGRWSMKQKNLYVMESMLPAYGKARRLFPAEEEYSERTLANWLSFGFGAGIRSNTPTERRNEAFKRVNRELERVSTLNELGYLTEDDKQPRFGQTVNAAYKYLGIADEQ